MMLIGGKKKRVKSRVKWCFALLTYGGKYNLVFEVRERERERDDDDEQSK